MIVGVAVVSPQNRPIYFCDFLGDVSDPHRLQQIIYCSLDAVEEKVPPVGRPLGGWSDAYLGVIHASLDFRVAGYVTNTRHRLFLVVEDETMRDEDLRLIFRKLHAALADALSNPFYTTQTTIKSVSFAAAVHAIMEGTGV
ncbi:hypothetical protein ACKKBG_A04380 [Auxenochlorella protothecoides x Auxenochlorella symbiontica]